MSPTRSLALAAGIMKCMTAAADHFDRLADLLELESQAEARRLLEQTHRRSPEEAEAVGHCVAALLGHHC